MRCVMNNRGMTSIEVLISFIIVTAIAITLFDTVTSYKTKQQIESYKNSITEYKNSITKVINNDIVKYKLAALSSTSGKTTDSEKTTYKITLYFEKNLLTKANNCKDSSYSAPGCYKTLQVLKYHKSTEALNSKVDTIIYPEVSQNALRNVSYPLPDIGGAFDEDSGEVLKDIRFSSVSLGSALDNAVLDIAMFHHELSTYFHIYIVAPIHYYNLFVPPNLPLR